MDISRSLIHYSLVHEEFSKSRDIIKGLIPLFAPAIAKFNGHFFNPDTFTKELENLYGLKMHPYVAEDIVEKLEKEKLLVKTNSGKRTAYLNKCELTYSENENQKKKFQELVDDFTVTTNEMLQSSRLELNIDEIEKGFYHRLARLDYINEKTHDEIIDKKYEILDYSFARFVERINESNSEYKTILEEAHSGAMIAEVILNLKTPPNSDKKMQGIKILIDAPILVDLLGLADETIVEYTERLIEEIKRSGAILITSDYYIEEARELINSRLRNYHNEKRNFSDLDRFLLSSTLNVTKAESVMRDMESALRKKGINYNPNNYYNENTTSERAKKIEEEVYSALGQYQNEKAQERDAKSVSLVVVRNQYRPIYNINDADILFLTKNTGITETINSYLRRKKLIIDGTLSPVITDKKLATLLWVMHGGSGKNLVSSELLNNCHRAIESKASILRNAKETLFNLSNMSLDDRDHYESIINNKRATYCLLDKVGGNPDLIKGRDPKNLFDEIIKEIQSQEEEKYALKAEEEICKIKNKASDELAREKLKSENKVEREKSKNELRLLKLEERLTQVEDKNRQLEQEKNEKGRELTETRFKLKEIEAKANNRRNKIVSNAKSMSKSVEVLLIFGFIISIIYLTTIVVGLSNEKEISFYGIILTDKFINNAAPITVFILNLLLTWKIPDYSIRFITRHIEKKVFNLILKIRGLEPQNIVTRNTIDSQSYEYRNETRNTSQPTKESS